MTDDEVGACLKAMCYREIGPGVWWKAFGYMGFSYEIKTHEWTSWYRPASRIEEFEFDYWDRKYFTDVKNAINEDFLHFLQYYEAYVKKINLPMTNWLTSIYLGYT